ncbi:putative HTH-type transcriptional regulator YjiR [Pseudoalteromonas sp. P1-9]|nr:putative HTH-type transcriptional regulator YjiR [Pseudoalteromonas sp. P1-9]
MAYCLKRINLNIVMNTIWLPEITEYQKLCKLSSKYQALADLIERVAQSGVISAEQKLPAQRILADHLGVTHGTVTRAYDLLVKRGIATAKLGAGTFIKAQSVHLDELDDTDFSSSMMPLMGQQNVLAEQMRKLANNASALTDILRYKLNGNDELQGTFKAWLNDKGLQIGKQELIFCQGAQQAIYSVLAALCQAGDTVLHEEMCYPGFYQACDSLGLNTKPIALTPEGIDLNALEAYCKSNSVKAIYITPNCQNPTNIRYDQATLDGLLALSQRYNFFILEDDVNYCLPENWRLPLWQTANDRVFYIGSFSKYFAGGLRAGYLIAPFLWQQAVLKQIHSQCWSVSMMNFELLALALHDDEFKRNQLQLADEVSARINLLRALFEKHGLKAVFSGLNVYLPLPEHINVFSLANQLKANRVIVRTVDVFTRNGNANCNALRFTLGGPSSRQAFELGLARVDQVLRHRDGGIEVVI